MTTPESRVRVLELAEQYGNASDVQPEDSAEFEWCTKTVSLIVVFPKGNIALTAEGKDALLLH